MARKSENFEKARKGRDAFFAGFVSAAEIDSSSIHPLFEDNHLLVVAKPAGLPVQMGTGHESSLLDLCKTWLKQKYDKPGNVFLGLVHRLDRSVGGVVVFAKTSKAAGRLSEQFRKRQVKKIYRALSAVPERSGTWKDGFAELNDGNASICEPNEPGAKDGVLSFETENRWSGLSLVRIHLETGRKHQIRLQFSHRGFPLLGDMKYGSVKAFYPGAIALEAHTLEFDHPISGERLSFHLPPSLSLIERYCAEYYPKAP